MVKEGMEGKNPQTKNLATALLPLVIKLFDLYEFHMCRMSEFVVKHRY